MTALTESELQTEEQGLFDQITTHLLKQNARAERELRPGIPHCMYRAPNGCKCAVGCLIPDDEYSPEMEKHDLYLVIDMLKPPLREKLKRHTQLLIQMQLIHDSKPIHKWEDEFESYATRNGLTMPEKETTNEEGVVEAGVQLRDIVGDLGDHLPDLEVAEANDKGLDIEAKESEHGNQHEVQAESSQEGAAETHSEVQGEGDQIQAQEGGQEGEGGSSEA